MKYNKRSLRDPETPKNALGKFTDAITGEGRRDKPFD
jgi:hypothetical protein